jgi:hypothetical protein
MRSEHELAKGQGNFNVKMLNLLIQVSAVNLDRAVLRCITCYTVPLRA